MEMVGMTSQGTRGRGEMGVTSAGVPTGVGRIAGRRSGVEREETPRTEELDQLTVVVTIMAGAALVFVVVLGLVRGEVFDDLFLVGISLAISAIPPGLGAVVRMLLSL